MSETAAGTLIGRVEDFPARRWTLVHLDGRENARELFGSRLAGAWEQAS